MKPVNPQTVEKIKADEFARSAIEAARMIICELFRDWNSISRDGKIMFTDKNAAIAYMGLCVLLGTEEPPDFGDAKVDVGGVMMSSHAIDMLQTAFRKEPL